MSRLVVSAAKLLEQIDAAEAADSRLTARNRFAARIAADLRAAHGAAQRRREAAEFAATVRYTSQIALDEQLAHRSAELALLDAGVVRCTCGAWRLRVQTCRPCALLRARRAVAS